MKTKLLANQPRLAYHGNLQYVEGGGRGFYRHYGQSLPLPRTKFYYFMWEMFAYGMGIVGVVALSMMVIWAGI